MAKIIRKKIKSILKSEAINNTISWLLSLYLKLVYKTSSWQIIGLAENEKLIKEEAVIACFWHGNMALTPFTWRWTHKKVVALISGHSDGMMIARIFKRLRIDSISGSTNRGGVKAFRGLLDALERKDVVAIIPDGPRGPARQLSEGIIQLAKHSGAPIMPLACATTRYRQFKSWDKFRLPLPFSRGVLIYGTPIYLDMNGKQDEKEFIEAQRQRVEQAISMTQDEADRIIGISDRESN